MLRPRISRSLKAVVDMDGGQRRQGLGFRKVREKVADLKLSGL